MQRTLCVWFPTFATDLTRRRLARFQHPGARGSHPAHAQPVLLTRRVAQREVIERCCALSQWHGVRPGMDLSQARTLLPARMYPHIEPFAPQKTALALRAAACWALRFSPVVAPDGEDGLAIDLSGTQLVHADERRLLRTVAAQLLARGFASRCAVASTYACAWGVARHSQAGLSVVQAGGERAAMHDLPVLALALDEPAQARLAEVGVTTVGEVLALPRAGLVARYGAGVALRLDEALGRTLRPTPLTPVQPRPMPQACMMFDGPTDHAESVAQAAREVLGTLAKQLAEQQRGVRRLRLRVHRPRVSGHEALVTDVEVTLSRASSNAAHLWRLARTAIERVDLGAGVEGVTITALRTARLRHQQTTIASGGEPVLTQDAALGELIDTLVSRLGPRRVLHADPIASHIPERAWIATPVLEDRVRPAPATPIAAERPTLLYPSPEPASVVALTPDGPVHRLRWRGEDHRILCCEPPERIAPEWWRTSESRLPPDRMYIAAQTQGGRWLFLCKQIGTGAWFVHGEWS